MCSVAFLASDPLFSFPHTVLQVLIHFLTDALHRRCYNLLLIPLAVFGTYTISGALQSQTKMNMCMCALTCVCVCVTNVVVGLS